MVKWEYIIEGLEDVVTAVTYDKEMQKDIVQDAVLVINETRDFLELDGLKGYLFITCRNIYINKCKERKHYELPSTLVDKKETHIAPNVKSHAELLEQLTYIERRYIEEWIKCDFNYSELARKTGIARRHITIRIKSILNKWKNLDIYLDA